MIIKKSTHRAYLDSFEIWDSVSAIYKSPTFEDDTIVTLEVCLPKTYNLQYSLLFHDAHPDHWAPGAYLDIRGVYNNTFFKTYMKDDSVEQHVFSLNYPIRLYSICKFTSGLSLDNWTVSSFDDANWESVPLGTVPEYRLGTQYFRLRFNPVPNMVAYEVQFFYRYGIVAYIEGLEIWRDNMPQGAISNSTVSTGDYGVLGYHGVIRSARDLPQASTVLAVEIHYATAESHTIDFDAWLAVYAQTLSEALCYVIPLEPHFDSTPTIEGLERLTDYDMDSVMQAGAIGSGILIDYEYLDAIVPAVSGIRIYSQIYPKNSPKSFTVSYSSSEVGHYQEVIATKDMNYGSLQHKILTTPTSEDPYRYWRVYVSESESMELSIAEMQLLVCNLPRPQSFEYEKYAYFFQDESEEVSIQPTIVGIHDCIITPNLPSGLTLDRNTCSITGSPIQEIEPTLYTVTAPQFGGISASFTLTIHRCHGVLLELVRTFQRFSSTEAFSISNSDTVLFDQPFNSTQKDHSTWNSFICVTDDRIRVSLSAQNTIWDQGSFLYIYSTVYAQNRKLLLRAKVDGYLKLPTTYDLSLSYIIPAHSKWFYHMGSIPIDWTSEEISEFHEAYIEEIPDSSNQIQLFKQSFNLTSIPTALEVSLRFLYGCVIYLNGVEVYRHGINETVTNSTLAITAYSTLQYHTITIPTQLVTALGTKSQTLVKESNVIGVALISMAPTQKTCVFDMAVQVIQEENQSRVGLCTITGEGLKTDPANAFAMDYRLVLSSDDDTNMLIIQFTQDRHELIRAVDIMSPSSSLEEAVTGFSIKARDSDNDNWILLRTVDGIEWDSNSQTQRITIVNNNPYNQYAIQNLHSSHGTWKLGQLDLQLMYIPKEVDPLVAVDADIPSRGMMIPFPLGPDSYTDYYVDSPLPEGLYLNSITGMVTGQSARTFSTTSYRFYARSLLGEVHSSNLTLSIYDCQGLITIGILPDAHPLERAWKLYHSDKVLFSASVFPVSLRYFYLDFCLQDSPDPIYTFEAISKEERGWVVPSGFMVSISNSTFIYDMDMVPNSESIPFSRKLKFTSTLPFTAEDQWKVLQTDSSSVNWMDPSLDDSKWSSVMLTELHNVTTKYTYLRMTPMYLSQATVINIRVLHLAPMRVAWDGSVVAEFDGNESPRYDLFHVIVASNAHTIAFQFVNVLGESPVIEILGVYGVDTCSVVLDSYEMINGTTPLQGDLNDWFDLHPERMVLLPNRDDTFMRWIVRNKLGSTFNAYGFYSTARVAHWGFTLYGSDEELKEYQIHTIRNFTSEARKRTSFDTGIGVYGFKEFQWEIDQPSSGINPLSAFFMMYCTPESLQSCSESQGFPVTKVGQKAMIHCPSGYHGYRVRECQDSNWGPIEDHCIRDNEPNHLIWLWICGGVLILILIAVLGYRWIVRRDPEQQPLIVAPNAPMKEKVTKDNLAEVRVSVGEKTTDASQVN